MPRVIAKQDNLDARNREFDQISLKNPVFLNSVPKCGTHLLKNIVRMFVPVEQQYQETFIQHPNLREHIKAFDTPDPVLSWGHLLFSDMSAICVKNVRHIVLVRDPYDWVLARARFFLSENFQADLDHVKGGRVDLESFLNMMIFGIPNRVPTLQEIFMHNAVAWIGTNAFIIRYEDLVKHVSALDKPEAKQYFENLFSFTGIEIPDDWKSRIEIGSQRSQSGTARENLDSQENNIPDTLPTTQKKLVDFASPNLRSVLGYCD